MILKKLEMYGFKSFADRIDMHFDKGITGIVGPNGSGKSNVSDAVRWVLGEQSAKQLRGGTMQDVIFSGTQKRKSLPYCEVSLTFDNADKGIDILYDEIMVTRRVYRSGESEYFLNKTACRLKDIVDLFRDTGIGRDGYSLIGQGRIDSILSSRSEDRRQVFEEAAGIVKFKARKDEAEKRLENTRQNLTRIGDIIDELTKTIGPLGEQAEAARVFLRLSDTLKRLELGLYARRYCAWQEKSGQLTAQIEGLEAALADMTGREAALVAAQAGHAGMADEIERQLTDMRERLLSLTADEQAAIGQIGLIEQRAEALRAEQAGLLEQLKRDTADRQALTTADIERLRADKLATIADKENELAAMLEALAGERADLETAEAGLEALKQRVIDSLNRMSDHKAARSRMTAMAESVEERLEKARDAHAGLEDSLNGHEAALAEAQRAHAASLSEQADIAKALGGETDAQAIWREKLGQAFDLLERYKGAQREESSRLKLLEQMQRDYEGYQQSVREVLRKARADGDGAIHGVVAELIRVPKDIERAIETALGAQAQNIICDDEYGAKRMIEFLRENRYGRATFLPVASVKGRTLNRHEREALSMRGCLGVAADMVGCDEKHRDIVNYLLGRTLVADSLDHGIAIMRRLNQSVRLVTTAGDVMNPGGAMTGGSLPSRTAGLFTRGREIDEMRLSLGRIDESIAAAEKQVADMRAKRDALRQSVAELTERQRQQDIACLRDAERLSQAGERLSAHREAISQSALEIEQLTQAGQDIARRLAALDDEHKDTGADNAREQELAEEAALDVQQRRRALDAAQEAAAQARLEIERAQGEADMLTRDERYINERRESLDRAIARVQRQIDDINGRLPGLTDDISAENERLAAIAAKRAALTGQISATELRHIKARQAGRDAQAELDSLRVKAREASDRAHRAQLTLTRLTADINAFTERVWEDYELTYAGALPYLTPDFNEQDAVGGIDDTRRRIRQLGSVNVNAVEEYRAAQERLDGLNAQKDDLTGAIDDLNVIISELDEKMRAQFARRFAQMNENFGRTFARLFGGGQAQLKLSDPNDPLACGIDIVAQPPGKKLQLLSLLSGGERALTAIAILFAMLMLKPTPFCILDEIDAALDEANVTNFAGFLAEFSKDTQFIVVTHRKGTMESCTGLYGIAMEEKGVSSIVSVKLS